MYPKKESGVFFKVFCNNKPQTSVFPHISIWFYYLELMTYLELKSYKQRLSCTHENLCGSGLGCFSTEAISKMTWEQVSSHRQQKSEVPYQVSRGTDFLEGLSLCTSNYSRSLTCRDQNLLPDRKKWPPSVPLHKSKLPLPCNPL